jgi:hypothetical protein
MTSIITIFALSIRSNHINIWLYNDIFTLSNGSIMNLSSNHISIMELTIWRCYGLMAH